MKKRKRKIKINYFNIFMFVVIIGILIFLYLKFQGISQTTFYITNQTIINKLEEQQTRADCVLSLEDTSIKVGEYARGSIHNGVFTFCQIYSQKDGNWKIEFEGTTNINGDLSGSKLLEVGGTYLLKGLCGYGTEKECVTNGITLTVDSEGIDTDGDGYSDLVENDYGSDPDDKNDYPGHRVCEKITNPAFQTACDSGVTCSSGYKCTFHISGGIGGSRWCSCDRALSSDDFCISLNKGYTGGRETGSCSECNYITEICEVDINTNKVYCCTKSTITLGCNDLDFTKDNFDLSLKSSTSCSDDLGTHLDACKEGLLQEWYCTDAMDSCKSTYYNCENMLGLGYYCSGGECKFNQDIVICDLGCAGVTGPRSESIPFTMIPKPLTCPDYPTTQCPKGVYNIGSYQDKCCCWNCK